MIYGTTKLALPIPPDDWRVRLLRLLLWFVPRANPDHERLYPRVRTWVLEIDESGVAVREIGLDESGAPLFGAPSGRNFGYFTDSGATFTLSDIVAIDAARFEELWSHCVSQSGRAA